MKTILLVGQCGSGKTWVMKQLIEIYNLRVRAKIGTIKFITNAKIAVLGKYDGTTFEGSDKLSMAVMKDCDLLKKTQIKNSINLICEGDRFTNSTFINKFDPYIIKIIDNGQEGREKRKSEQSARHIKSIKTRVQNTRSHTEVRNSTQALELIKKIIDEKD